VRIAVTRTGGIAGVPLAVEVDTARLAPEVATRVERSVTRLLDAAAAAPPPHPDAFSYRIGLADDPSGRVAVVHEGQVPPELHPLVEAVSERGRVARRARREGRAAAPPATRGGGGTGGCPSRG
jgi:hypothetical protein